LNNSFNPPERLKRVSIKREEEYGSDFGLTSLFLTLLATQDCFDY